MIESSLEAGFIKVELVSIVVLLSEDLVVPLEILQQDEAPSLVEVDQLVHLIENEVEFREQFDKRQYLIILFLNHRGLTYPICSS